MNKLIARFVAGLTCICAVACASGTRQFNPTALPPTSGGYTHIAVTGNLVFIAGQVSADSAGQVVGSGDMAVQARQVYTNLATALRAAGVAWDNVVKTTTYVTDVSQLQAVRDARRAVLGTGAPPNTLVQVVRLARPEFLIEVEAIAARR